MSMSPEVRAALVASIEKWEANAAAKSHADVKIGTGSCKLCSIFNTLDHLKAGTECKGCPVFLETGRRGCEGTPYGEAVRRLFAWSDNDRVDAKKRFHIIARKEAAFLKSLLPEDDK